MMREYYYADNAEQFTFYRIPKMLFTDSQFSGLSVESKVLYGLLLDRMSLSLKNNWLDEQGRVFIIYTIDEIMESLKCAEQKAAKLLNELEREADLIERKRQGLGKPNLIYVKSFTDTISASRQSGNGSQILNCENHNSGIANITDQDFPESQTNNTEINDTELKETEINPIPSAPLKRERLRDAIRSDAMDERLRMRKYLEDRLDFESLKESNPSDINELTEIFEIILDTVCSTQRSIRIGGDEKPMEVVKNAFLKLESTHIEYVLNCFRKNTTEVRNVRAYMLTMLYNAPFTISSYFTSAVHHDMPGLAK